MDRLQTKRRGGYRTIKKVVAWITRARNANRRRKIRLSSLWKGPRKATSGLPTWLSTWFSTCLPSQTVRRRTSQSASPSAGTCRSAAPSPPALHIPRNPAVVATTKDDCSHQPSAGLTPTASSASASSLSSSASASGPDHPTPSSACPSPSASASPSAASPSAASPSACPSASPSASPASGPQRPRTRASPATRATPAMTVTVEVADSTNGLIPYCGAAGVASTAGSALTSTAVDDNSQTQQVSPALRPAAVIPVRASTVSAGASSANPCAARSGSWKRLLSIGIPAPYVDFRAQAPEQAGEPAEAENTAEPTELKSAEQVESAGAAEAAEGDDIASDADSTVDIDSLWEAAADSDLEEEEEAAAAAAAAAKGRRWGRGRRSGNAKTPKSISMDTDRTPRSVFSDSGTPKAQAAGGVTPRGFAALEATKHRFTALVGAAAGLVSSPRAAGTADSPSAAGAAAGVAAKAPRGSAMSVPSTPRLLRSASRNSIGNNSCRSSFRMSDDFRAAFRHSFAGEENPITYATGAERGAEGGNVRRSESASGRKHVKQLPFRVGSAGGSAISPTAFSSPPWPAAAAPFCALLRSALATSDSPPVPVRVVAGSNPTGTTFSPFATRYCDFTSNPPQRSSSLQPKLQKQESHPHVVSPSADFPTIELTRRSTAPHNTARNNTTRHNTLASVLSWEQLSRLAAGKLESPGLPKRVWEEAEEATDIGDMQGRCVWVCEEASGEEGEDEGVKSGDAEEEEVVESPGVVSACSLCWVGGGIRGRPLAQQEQRCAQHKGRARQQQQQQDQQQPQQKQQHPQKQRPQTAGAEQVQQKNAVGPVGPFSHSHGNSQSYSGRTSLINRRRLGRSNESSSRQPINSLSCSGLQVSVCGSGCRQFERSNSSSSSCSSTSSSNWLITAAAQTSGVEFAADLTSPLGASFSEAEEGREEQERKGGGADDEKAEEFSRRSCGLVVTAWGAAGEAGRLERVGSGGATVVRYVSTFGRHKQQSSVIRESIRGGVRSWVVEAK